MPRMALFFRQLFYALTILPLTIHAANTDYDGAWDVVANCGVNASNGRPGFSSRLEWNIQHGKIQEVQVHRNASPREQTTWDGAIREGRVELVGVGTREPSDKWTWRLSGSAINNRLIKLSGAMVAGDRHLRNCSIEMSLREPQPISLAGRAISQSQVVSPPASQVDTTFSATNPQNLANVTPLKEPRPTVQDSVGVQTVIAEGVGKDLPSASQNAAQYALINVAGSFIDASKLIEKRTTIEEGIRTQTSQIRSDVKEYSQGTIKSFEIESLSTQNGLTRITAKVSVRIEDFRAYVKKLAEGTVGVDTSLFAQITTEQKQNQNRVAFLTDNVFLPVQRGEVIVLNVGAPVPISQADLSREERKLAGELEKKYGASSVVTFDVAMSLNSDFWINMSKTLQSISTKSVKKQISDNQVNNLPGTLHQFCQTEFHPIPKSDFCAAVLFKDHKTNWLQLHFATGIQVDLEKAVPWWFKTDPKSPHTLPTLAVSLIDSAGQNLQLEELDSSPHSRSGLIRNDKMIVYSLDRNNSSTVPWSLTSTLPTPYPTIFQQGKFRVMLAVSTEALRDTRKINVKLRQRAP